jgi:transposase
VQRAKIVLFSGDRLSVLEVARRAGVSRPAVWRWQKRFPDCSGQRLRRQGVGFSPPPLV